MTIKPHIFIGSSSEGLDFARALKTELSSWAECDIWDEPGVFEPGKGFLENLMERLNLYEYGIMIATGDDKTKSRGVSKMAPRDNVLFELGLFMGRLGRDRAFCLFEKDSKLPSDFLGVTLPSFPKSPGRLAGVKPCVDAIKLHVENQSTVYDGSIFPCVPLAFGYYHNFVEIVCKRLFQTKEALVGGVKTHIPSFELSILIPDDLDDDMKNKVAFSKGIKKWQQISVTAPETRAYDFFADVTFGANGHAILKDVPTTLLSLHQTIKEFLGGSKVGFNRKEKLVEEREIRRFKAVLDHLISKGSFTRHAVSTEIVDI
jgi:hypothetical protein